MSVRFVQGSTPKDVNGQVDGPYKKRVLGEPNVEVK